MHRMAHGPREMSEALDENDSDDRAGHPAGRAARSSVSERGGRCIEPSILFVVVSRRVIEGSDGYTIAQI